ncbi:MAG: carboxymuconolactone decarboxylase family protein [bacterium]
MSEQIEDFIRRRKELNKIIMENSELVTRRFFNLDEQAYKPGALNSKTKEMLGLIASVVLRCDDCIYYHLINCYRQKLSDAEFSEVMSIALIVGGSITIPHVRRAYQHWSELKKGEPHE